MNQSVGNRNRSKCTKDLPVLQKVQLYRENLSAA